MNGNQSVIREVIKNTDRLPLRISTPIRVQEYTDPRIGCALTIPLHCHDHLEVIYMHDDVLQVHLETQTYELQPGDLMIINAGDIHSTYISSLPCQYLLLQIPSQLLVERFADFERLRFEPYLSAAEVEAAPRLKALLRDMEALRNAAEDGYELLLTARLYELLHLLYKRHSRRTAPSALDDGVGRDRRRVAETIEWTQAHYSEPLTLEDAAAHLSISREYFCRIFKKYTGQTYLEFLSETRTMHFYRRLQQSDDPVPLLMEQSGLTNYKTFIRTFKQMYGTTPQKARRQFRRE